MALAAHAKRFPDLRPDALKTDGLDSREAGLAKAMHDAAVRHWLSLQFVLDLWLSKPLHLLEPRMQGVLLCGACQILLMDRVPTHAALNESVNWAKRRIRPGAGKLVNAVLRRVASLTEGERMDGWESRRDALPLGDGQSRVLLEPVFPEDEVERLSIATSCPAWLLERWMNRYGQDEARRLAFWTLGEPPIIVSASLERAASHADVFSEHDRTGSYVFTGDRGSLVSVLGEKGDGRTRVQDPASAASLELARELMPSTIVDVCAGVGTKTGQLRQMFPDADVFATDLSEHRLSMLQKSFASDSRVHVVPLADLVATCAGRAELVLLDVPCSNSGVLSRRIEAKYRCGDKQLQRLVGQQRQIMADAIPLLRPPGEGGGHMLYATCSLEPEENEQQAAWLEKWHPFSIVAEQRTLPAGAGEPGVEPKKYHDGSFAILLRYG